MLFRDLPASLNAVPPACKQKPPGKPCSQVPKYRGPHPRIQSGVGIAANHRSRMLGAPPPSGEVNDRDVDVAKDGQPRGQGSHLWTFSKLTQQQIAGIDQPKHQGRGQARIPGPPDTPYRPGPEWPLDQHQGAEHHAHLGRSQRRSIGAKRALGMVAAGSKINNRSRKADEEEQKRHHRRGEMVVEDTLDVAHGSLSWRDIHALVESVTEQAKGECQPAPAEYLHHATPQANKTSLDHS